MFKLYFVICNEVDLVIGNKNERKMGKDRNGKSIMKFFFDILCM